MKYLLDTCCISDFVKGETGTLTQIKNCLPTDLALSSITFFEIEYGLFINPQRAKKIQKPLFEFINCINLLPFSEHSASYAAKIRGHLRTKGTPIGSYDVLIAASALENNLSLVTSNEKEFRRVPNLMMENWRNN